MQIFIGACLVLVAATGPLEAASVTFASFTEANGTNDFSFVNNGNGTGTFDASSQINFTFFPLGIPAADLSMGPLPTAPIAATLTRTGSISGAATCNPSCTTDALVTQVLTNSTFVITRNSDGAVLLDASGSEASLFGDLGGSTATVQNSAPPNSLVFTSAFVNFLVDKTGRSASFTSVSPDLSIAPDGLLNSFTAAASGSFSAEFAPEPGSAVLMMVGLLLLGFFIARRIRA